MKKADIIEQLALHNDIENGTKAAAGRVFEDIMTMITDTLAKGEDVEIPGFGKFVVQTQAAKSGVALGKAYTTPEKKVVKFRPAAQLKRTVAGE